MLSNPNSSANSLSKVKAIPTFKWGLSLIFLILWVIYAILLSPYFSSISTSVILFIQKIPRWAIIERLFILLSKTGKRWFTIPVILTFINFSSLQRGFIIITGIGEFMCISNTIKLYMQGPRPYWVSREIYVNECNLDYGFPSNHSIICTLLYGSIVYILCKGKGNIYRGTCLVGIFLVYMLFTLLGRLYLGVHSLDQILVGVVLGSVLLYFLITNAPYLSYHFKLLFYNNNIAYNFWVSLFLLLPILLLLPYIIYYTGSPDIREEYITNIRDKCGIQNINFQTMRMESLRKTQEQIFYFFSILGIFLGRYLVGFNVIKGSWGSVSIGRKLARWVIGLIFYALAFAFTFIPTQGLPAQLIFKAILPYALIGIFIFGLWPWISLTLGLLHRNPFGSHIYIRMNELLKSE